MGTDILTCRRGRRCDGQECLDFALCTLHFSLCTQLEHANCHSRTNPKRERGNRAAATRSRFGLVWLVGDTLRKLEPSSTKQFLVRVTSCKACLRRQHRFIRCNRHLRYRLKSLTSAGRSRMSRRGVYCGRPTGPRRPEMIRSLVGNHRPFMRLDWTSQRGRNALGPDTFPAEPLT